MSKPLFPYHGGKQRIASRIVDQILKIPHMNYAEPFAGGLAVLYAKPYITPDIGSIGYYQEFVNDLDDNVVNLYRVARRNPEALLQELQLTPYSQSEYKYATQIIKDSQSSEFDRAWAFYYLLVSAFSHCPDRQWGYGRLSQNRAYTFRNYLDAFLAAVERLKYVNFFHEDALHFIKRLDSPYALFYCDPPYVGTATEVYVEYTLQDYQNLCDLLDSIQGSYILSCSSTSFSQHQIEPKSYDSRIEISTYKTFCVTQNAASSLEYLWIKDRSKNMTDLHYQKSTEILSKLQELRKNKRHIS